MREGSLIKNENPRENSSEKQPTREIDVYFFRHGQASDESPEAELTELGKKQAEEAAEKLLAEVQREGGVIKFLFSGTRRAVQTMEIMQEYIRKAISENNLNNVRLFNPREREAVAAAGVIGPLRKQGVKDPVEYWLTNPDVLEGKSPSEISEKIKEMLSGIKKIADRLPAGEKIHYVTVTHEIPQAALINSATGKTLNQLGGGMENCESFRIQMEGKSENNPTIDFRGNEAELVL